MAWSSSGAETLIAALADGAGSAERAEAGARLATSIFVDVAAEHFKERNGSALPACELVRTGIEAAHAAVSAMAAHEDREIDDFASTLLVAILHAGGGAIGQIGDGAVVFSRGTERPWEPALWPDHGEYVNTTRFLTDADAFEQLRVVEVTGPVGSVCLFSDGLERLVLDFRTRTRAAGSA